MIDEEESMDINALHRQGFTCTEIARMLGRDWRTVKRYLAEGEKPTYRRKGSPSKLDPFKRCDIARERGESPSHTRSCFSVQPPPFTMVFAAHCVSMQFDISLHVLVNGRLKMALPRFW